MTKNEAVKRLKHKIDELKEEREISPSYADDIDSDIQALQMAIRAINISYGAIHI